MEKKSTFLRICILGFLAFFLIAGNVNAVICTCSDCSTCTDALNNNSCDIVKLNADITNQTGTCINNPVNFSNKIFDCQGFTIDGNVSVWGSGIYLSEKQNNTIKNCIITDFSDRIYLYSSSNNILLNNTANTNTWAGIRLESSSNNTITNNTANNNTQYGIYLHSSSNNILTNNTANNNNLEGISLHSSSNNNILTNNTANTNHWHGIILYSSSHNTLTNNTANSNDQNGIYLHNSSNNTLISNRVNLNNGSGIFLSSSSNNNTLTNNTAHSNNYGIYLCNNIGIFSQKSNSTINSNIVCGNTYLDFNSSIWQGSSGDNNTCDKPDGWNDTGSIGCKNKCITEVKTYYVSLNYGWNLVSIPITPKNTSIKSVLSSVEGKYTKVGAWINGTGKHYIPDFPFNTLNSIDEKMGFWIKMNQSANLTVEGYAPENRSIPLQTGWNLVGYLSTNKTLPLASALSSINGKYTKVGAWINGTGKHYIPVFPFNTLINMGEGYGYWIKMNASDVLEY